MIYETSITNPKKQLEFYKDLSKELQKENEKLKKQLENCYCNRTDCSSRIKDSKQYDSLVQKVKSQQKMFIEYLEKNINHYKEIIKLDRENNTESDCRRFEARWTTYEEILLKYKEIIGEKE